MARSTKTNDEAYVIALCDELLGLTAFRQQKFDFLCGDVGKAGQRRRLPVDAYYDALNLVIEYREVQHTKAVAFFDKPKRVTISGVHRGEQRALYDQRRRELLPQHGITLIEISYADFDHDHRGRLLRNKESDLTVLRRVLNRWISKTVV